MSKTFEVDESMLGNFFAGGENGLRTFCDMLEKSFRENGFDLRVKPLWIWGQAKNSDISDADSYKVDEIFADVRYRHAEIYPNDWTV